MKNLCILCAAIVLVASMSAVVSAGELSVPKSTLNSMGFSSVSVMSDNDGLAVRGKGTSASVWGQSTAVFGPNTSTNGYSASASHYFGSSTAVGHNNSFAGITNTFGHFTSSTIVSAGGSSSAFAR